MSHDILYRDMSPENGFSPKMTYPLKMVSPQKMAFSGNIFVGSRYKLNNSDKPKLKEDYHHSTNMSSKYVLALLQKSDFIFKVLSTVTTRKWDPECYNLLW